MSGFLSSFLPKSMQKPAAAPPSAAEPRAAAEVNDARAALPVAFGAVRARPVSGIKRDRERFEERTSGGAGGKDANSAPAASGDDDVVLAPVARAVDVEAVLDIEDDAHEKWPVSHQADMKSHTKQVCALDVERSGTRLITGALDYTIKMWEFPGMDSTMQPFRTMEPREAHGIRWLRFSKKGTHFAVAPGSNQAKVYDRNGEETVEFVRGDMYLAQMKATKGHVALVTCCEWDPLKKQQLMTCSLDSTVRIWDIDDRKCHKQIILGKPRVGFNVAAYSPDGNYIVGAQCDGLVQMWDTKGSLSRPDSTVSDSVPDVCSIAWDAKSDVFAVRSLGDSSMRLYDSRMIKKPLHWWRDQLPSTGNLQHVSCLFSPDNSMLVTASGRHLHFYSRRTFALLDRVEVTMEAPTAAITTINWNAKINQIVCGASDGAVKVLYDPEISSNGAILCVARPSKRLQQEQSLEWEPGMGQVFNPLLEEEERKREDKNRMTRKQRLNAGRPELPATGARGIDGQQGTSQQHLLLKKLLKLEGHVPEDPRTALLKYDAIAKSDPRFFTAYQETQPEPIFDYDALEAEEAKRAAEGKKEKRK